MKILVLQHIWLEDPGYIKALMQRDGWQMEVVEIDEGQPIPVDINHYDAMLCMGGPMDTWMEEQYPWLAEEKRRIREFVVDLQKPFLGVCLGCQLLGEVVGGRVARSNPPEIGVLDVNIHSGDDMIFGAFPDSIKALQWHSYEVTELENHPQVALLASSSATKYQAFRYGKNAYGAQFHIEICRDTVRSWANVPEYKTALENALGDNAVNAMDAQAAAHMEDMNRHAGLLYEGFKRLISP